MPKPSAMLRKIKAEAEKKFRLLFLLKMKMLKQMCVDAAFLAASDVFQMGPGRCEAFGKAMLGYIDEMAALMNEDAKDDPEEMVYAREVIDRRLHQICGKKFDPWEVRYRDDQREN